MSNETDSWRPANFDEGATSPERDSGWVTPGPSPEDVKIQGFMSGFEQGRNEGLMRARQEMEAERRRMGLLFSALERMYEQTEDDTIEELAFLAGLVAEQVVRSELTLQPEQLRALVSELLAQLPPGYKKVTVAMHRDVLQTLQASINSVSDDDDSLRWRLVADDEIMPGDFSISTDDSFISLKIREMVESMITSALQDLIDNTEAGT
ncbi:MAG: FliH/SctL family protein [Pseudomonadota bacterium]